jgi:putative transcriptional regulator
MSKMFDLLKEGLEEAIAYHQGKVKLHTKEVFVPDMPKSYKAADIKKLREKLKFSQNALATWLNVSLNTVQSWEQGIRNPSHAVLRLLDIFDKDFHSIASIYESKPEKKKSHSKVTFSTYISEKPQERFIAKSKQYSLKKRKK